MIRVPMLVPGLEYTFEIQVECVSDLGISDQLHVFVTRDQVCKCTSDGLGTKNAGSGWIRVMVFRPGGPGTRRIWTRRIWVK